MTGAIEVALALVLILGVGAAWIAWRVRLPSILLLILTGLVAGPVLGILDPDELFGELLLPIVSFSVAVILFEGGLSLNLQEIRGVGAVVRNLVTIGALVTWAITVGAAMLLLDMALPLAVLFGAILVVTGPTVIVPMLRHLRPTGHAGPVAKWEGMLIDPIGAILSVLVFEALIASSAGEATAAVLLTVSKALVIGVVVGVAGALLLYQLLRRHLLPEHLDSPVTLMIVLVVFVTSNLVQTESGLLAVTIMGIGMANQRSVAVKHIMEFKENLQVLLISSLFILLAARLDRSALEFVNLRTMLFLGVLIFIARPLIVALATLRSTMRWRERIFLAWLAPRGIVAAAISSVFALRLSTLGYEGAEALVPLTFLVILGTVTLYGLSSPWLAYRLGVADPNPQGLLLVGAHPWARDLAAAVKQAGYRVVLVDTNKSHVQSAWEKGLNTYHGNPLHQHTIDSLPLNGIGRVLALTPNDEINALTSLHFQDLMGRKDVYQLPPADAQSVHPEAVTHDLHGRLLFGADHTYRDLLERFTAGARFVPLNVSAPDPEEDAFGLGPEDVPVMILRRSGELALYTADHHPTPQPGDRVLALTHRQPAETSSEDSTPPTHSEDASNVVEE